MNMQAVQKACCLLDCSDKQRRREISDLCEKHLMVVYYELIVLLSVGRLFKSGFWLSEFT